MVYCQNDQHWPWFIATVINGTLSEFFSQTKQIFVPWLLVFVLSISFISSLKGKKNQLYFSFASAPSHLFIFLPLQLKEVNCYSFASARLRSLPPLSFPLSPSSPLSSLPLSAFVSTPETNLQDPHNNFTEWSFAFCFNLSSSDVTSECISFFKHSER